ncbi:MAG: stage V sporulation protein AE [Clostridia bacterium]|nr:stage V sporulation protein AE [Clostridia bacterium]MBQ2326566.1 stage V sporulation protein AE [Clostridia bacterium]MBQ5812748.1 stage V sporulation protein AE [Clostridia bacterium]
MEYIRAFICGGIICALSQVLIDRTRLTPARILTSYVVLGVILTAIGVYEPIVEWGGCGATTPLFGFGYTMAKGVETAVDQYGIVGALTGGLTAAAGGISAAVFFSLLGALIFKSKPKN